MKTVTPLSADSHLLVRSHLFTSEEINVILLPLKYEIFFSCTALQLLKIGAFVFLKFYPSSHMTEEPGMTPPRKCFKVTDYFSCIVW